MSIAPDNLFIDTGFAQCCHYAEKACGDAVAFKRIPAEELAERPRTMSA